ncbi:MAG: hypothetical protein KKC42_02860, partial [Candidatus Omnitrophica bacterium]|nr:hypothetical protein [Candidatus Omnitrophota bacterium]
MEKRLVIAIALSLLILLSWQALAPKPQLVEKQEVTAVSLPQQQAASTPVPALSVASEVPLSSLINYSREEFDLVFVEPQAALKEILFKGYKDYKVN